MFDELDRILFLAINQYAGDWTLDRIVGYEEGNNFFKGGLMVAAFCYFWFAESPERAARRRTIVAVTAASYLALVVNRLLAFALPFRMRPMYDAATGYHAPAISFPINLEDWSSFPSDTATYFFALAAGVFLLSRPLSIVLMFYAVGWICLPRIYLGVHYPSDILAGALLGIGAVLLVHVTRAERLAGSVLAIEKRYPGPFYCLAFMAAFEMAVIFDDVRNVLRGVIRGLRAAGRLAIDEGAALFLIGLILVAMASITLLWIRRHLSPPRADAVEGVPSRTAGGS
jgi:membrane-associated phospholipid phosphatase